MGALTSFVALATLATGIAGVTPTAADQMENRTFESVAVTQNGQARPLLPGTVIELRIAGGILRARAGGNLISGQVSVEDTELIVTSLRTSPLSYGSDQRAQDNWLGQFLGAGPEWTLTDDELLLRVDTTEIRLAGRPETDRPLTGTYWLLESTSRPGAAPVAPRVHAHLVFDGDEVDGGLSCNWLGGPAMVGDGSVVFTDLGMSKAMCREEDIMLEITIFAVLDGEVAFDLAAGRLDLTGADGRSLHLRAAF